MVGNDGKIIKTYTPMHARTHELSDILLHPDGLHVLNSSGRTPPSPPLCQPSKTKSSIGRVSPDYRENTRLGCANKFTHVLENRIYRFLIPPLAVFLPSPSRQTQSDGHSLQASSIDRSSYRTPIYRNARRKCPIH